MLMVPGMGDSGFGEELGDGEEVVQFSGYRLLRVAEFKFFQTVLT